MADKRVYKYNIVGDDQDKISKFLSNPMFSKRIVNPYTNVGVIQDEDFVVQVEVVSSKRLKESSNNYIFAARTIELNDGTLDELKSEVKNLKEIATRKM